MKEVFQTNQFVEWLKKLRDNLAKVAILRRIERLRESDFGDSKSVGGKVFELRVDIGKGYRVYFMNRGSDIIILLLGGDKKTQSDDIKAAKKLAKEYEDGKTD